VRSRRFSTDFLDDSPHGVGVGSKSQMPSAIVAKNEGELGCFTGPVKVVLARAFRAAAIDLKAGESRGDSGEGRAGVERQDRGAHDAPPNPNASMCARTTQGATRERAARIVTTSSVA